MPVYLGFPVSPELGGAVREAIRRVREEPPATNHRALLTATIIDMTDTGIDFFAMEIVRRMALGDSIDRFVALALNTVRGGLHMIINRVGKRLDNQQFAALVDFLEEILLRAEGTLYVAFPAPPALTEQLRYYQHRVVAEPPATDHAWACYDLIVAFKHAALDFFFVRSTDRLGVGSWSKSVVSSGVAMANNTSNRLLRLVIVRLTDESLISIADFYESVMFTAD